MNYRAGVVSGFFCRRHGLNSGEMPYTPALSAGYMQCLRDYDQWLLRLELEIYPEDAPDQAIYLEGDSEDISIGGMSINIEPTNIREPQTVSSLGKTISNCRINVSVVTQTLLLKISGKIAWHREVVHNGAKTLALGMQFDEMSPKVRGLLFALFNSLD